MSKTKENEDQKKSYNESLDIECSKNVSEASQKNEKYKTCLKKLEEALEYAENLAKDLEAEKNKNVSLVMKCFSKSSCYYLI